MDLKKYTTLFLYNDHFLRGVEVTQIQGNLQPIELDQLPQLFISGFPAGACYTYQASFVKNPEESIPVELAIHQQWEHVHFIPSAPLFF